MSLFVKLGARYLCLLTLVIWPAIAQAGGHAKEVQPVKLAYKGKTYSFQYLGYKQPLVLDFAKAAGKRDAPFETLLGYYNTMKTMTDYEALQRSGDSDAPRATATYLKGGFVSEITPSLIDDIAGGLQADPGRSTNMVFQQSGGAISRVAVDATAFPHRYAQYNMMATIAWKPEQPGARHVAYLRKFWGTLAPHTHGFYTNEADDENSAEWNRNYQGNYARLLEIKRRYDPDNIFRLNANINPA